MLNSLPAWVLTEPVDVTLVHQDPDDVLAIYLVERAKPSPRWGTNTPPNAVVLSFNGSGQILLNGVYVNLHDDMIAVCSLVDEAAARCPGTGADMVMPLGITTRTEPYQESEAAIAPDPDNFLWVTHSNRRESDTSVTVDEAFLLLNRMTGLAARTALGDGLSRERVAQSLRELADAIETQDCAEDMSPIVFPMA